MKRSASGRLAADTIAIAETTKATERNQESCHPQSQFSYCEREKIVNAAAAAAPKVTRRSWRRAMTRIAAYEIVARPTFASSSTRTFQCVSSASLVRMIFGRTIL